MFTESTNVCNLLLKENFEKSNQKRLVLGRKCLKLYRLRAYNVYNIKVATKKCSGRSKCSNLEQVDVYLAC